MSSCTEGIPRGPTPEPVPAARSRSGELNGQNGWFSHAHGADHPSPRGARPRSRSRRRARCAGAVEASRAHPPVPGAARADVRAADARVLHAGVQLRRDLPRHAGPRPQRRRPALRGRDRPQAADRAVRVRGDLHLLRDHRALVGPRRRHARGRADRVAARHRGPATLRLARGLDRGRDVRRGHGAVRAAGRSGGELRGVHAAVDDGGDPVRASRARLPRGRGDRGRRRSPSRPARRRCSRSSTSSCARAGRRASARSRSGSPSPSPSSPSRSAPRSSSTGPCSATARTSA